MEDERREHVSERFLSLLALYRRPDSGEWGGQNLEDATGGGDSLVRVEPEKGSHREPGPGQARNHLRAMGFPPELWFASGEKETVDAVLLAALEDGTARAVLEETVGLGRRDRDPLLRIAR